MRRLDSKRHHLDDLSIDLTKVLVVAGWIWLFSLWVQSGGSPRKMVESVEAHATKPAIERSNQTLTATTTAFPIHRRQR